MNSKPKILIIDDNVDLCGSIADAIELDGYSTNTSHTAADGLEKIESSFCNIVLLDMKLPDSDGLTVLEKIKDISSDTEVIIFTAYAQMDTVIAAMNKDAFSFLPKPFEIPYLLTTIERALNKQKLIFENRILYQQTIDEEREWEETFDSISDLVSIHDKDLNIIRCNKAVIEKLNVDYSDIIGKKCHEVFQHRNECWPTCPLLRCKESLKPEATEEECMGGTFLMSCFPRLDVAGRFNGVVHIARDITDRKVNEYRLQESERKFRTLVNNIPGASYRRSNDENWTMEYISNEIEKISGYPSSDYIMNKARTFDSIIHPDDLCLVKETINDSLKNRKPFELEYRIIASDKRTRWVFDKGQGLFNESGKVLWLDGTIIDISGRKQAEDAMNTLVVTASENEGKKFFEKVVSCLYDWLGVDCVILGQVIDENSETALAMKKDGKFINDFSYELQGSPCGNVRKKGFCYYPEGVIDMFPDDETLIQWNVEGYVGISLKGKSGYCVGTLCALSNRRLELPPGAEKVLEIVSARASVEIQRMQAEELLQKSEQKFRAIFDNTFQFIGLLKPDGTLIEVNKGPLRFSDVKRSDVINKPVYEASWWSHSETLQELLKKSIVRASQGDFVRFEATHRKQDGTLAYIDTSLTPVKNMDGDIIFIIQEGRDITELKLVEETVHKLSQAIQQSNVIVVITDLEGNIEYVNPRFCESTGYEYDEIIGKNPRILKSGETPDEEYRELWKTITSGNEWRGEFHNKKKSGELYWENASISPIRDIEGNIINFLGIKEDITDKKKAERELIESEEKSRIVSDTANDAIIMIDNNGKVSYWNRASENMFGYTSMEAVGSEVVDLIIPDKYKQAHLKGFKEFKKTGKGPAIGKTLEYTAISKYGEEFPVEHSISSVNIKGQWHAVGIFRDITERLKTEEQLRISYKMASLGQLTAGVFHELLNPVNIISAHIQLLLLDVEEGSRTEEDLKSVQEEIKRIVKISDSLLRFSRKGVTEAEEIEINDLLERTICLLEPEMKLEKVVYIRQFDKNLQKISVSSDQLRQVFLNLFTNARDAMPDGGTITVSTESITGGEAPFVRIKISDTGCGIDKSKIHKVFDPFFTTKKEGRGTGLGLSTSYGIVEDHGGAMSVESKICKGTTFVIDLPVKIF